MSTMETTRTVRLGDPAATDRDAVGGKAAALARLRRQGLPVPDGFVLPTAVTAGLLEDSRTDGPFDVPEPVRAAVASALAELGGGPVAVRSSAVSEDDAAASWAGQFETVLGAEGTQEVCAAIGTVLASVHGQRVHAYGRDHDGRGARDARIAVLVQRLVPAEAAGVAFSANPVTGAREETLVSAVRGLGDRLVAGEVAADEFVVRGRDVEAVATPEEALGNDQVREVAALAERLEDLFGTPQDIEWAYGPDGLQLLQSRPITALPVPPQDDLPEGTWTKDTVHHPEPLHPLASVYLEALEHGIREGMCEPWGLLVDRVEQRMVGGEVYGRAVPVGGKEGAPPPWWVLAVLARIVPPMRARLRAADEIVSSGALEDLPRRWEQELRPAFRERVASLRDTDLEDLDDGALLAHLDDTVALLHDGQELHFRLFIPYAVALHELVTTGEEVLGWETPRTMELLQGLSTASSAPAVAMKELAELVASRPAARDAALEADGELLERLDEVDEEVAAAVRDHRDRWGLHTVNYDPGSPTVAERPELLATLLREEVERVEVAPRGGVDAARERARSEARRELGVPGIDAADRERFETALARAERAYPVREDNLFWTDSVPNGLLRRAALEVGHRLAARALLLDAEEAVWLEVGELREALRGEVSGDGLRGRIERRRAERRWVRANPGPEVLGGEPAPPPDVRGLPAPARRTNAALLWLMGLEGYVPTDEEAGPDADLVGTPASAGTHTGTVRVIRGEEDFERLRPGDVLVAPITAPAWSVLFARAGAVVTDTGGVLSHAAIVAREHGIPAVLGVGDATERLTDGTTVTVDGRTGTIIIQEEST